MTGEILAEATGKDQEMAKAPTAQGVSALLRKAGHTRAKGRGNNREPGFVVTARQGRDDAVSVTHDFASWSEIKAARYEKQLAEYAEAITAAGWTVEAAARELTVTAAETPAPTGPGAGETEDPG